jgi:excisionase family DNA binding protein
MALPTLLSKAAAAEALGGISVRTIDRLRAAGQIQSVQVGGQVRLIEESIDAYLASQIPPTPQVIRDEKYTPSIVKRRRAERLAREAA